MVEVIKAIAMLCAMHNVSASLYWESDRDKCQSYYAKCIEDNSPGIETRFLKCIKDYKK